MPPEWLRRGLVLQALYGIRSERLLCEQLGSNLLYRWFVGLSMDEAARDHGTCTKNRDRLVEHEATQDERKTAPDLPASDCPNPNLSRKTHR